MLQLDALADCLEDQLDLKALRKKPCSCPESVADNCALKIGALEAFIEELKDQNRILIETLTELENEARNRVRTMETVLERTAHSAKAYMVKLTDYEQMTRGAIKDKFKCLSVIKKLEKDKSNIRDHCNNLSHDISSLLRLISHARNTGRWDVGNLEFCEVTCEQVFGSIDRLDSWSGDLDHVDGQAPNLESPVQDHHNAAFKEFSVERPASVFSQSSFHTLGVSSGGHVTKKDAEVYKLQVELRHLHKLVTTMQAELSQRDRTTAELQVQIVDLNHEISLKDNECFVHHRQVTNRFSENGMSPKRASLADEAKHSGALVIDEKRETKSPQTVSDSSLDLQNGVPRLHELQAENDSLTDGCRSLTKQLAEKDEELHCTVERCSRLEEELADVERVWQELDACKEDNEVILSKLDSKRQKVQELRAALRQQRTAEVGVGRATQTEGGQEEVEEMKRLVELEQRHRAKASGLELVVGQLQDRMTETVTREMELVAENDRLRQIGGGGKGPTPELAEQLKALEETASGLRQELSVILEVMDHKNVEIENQKLTIRNLQEALMLIKRSPGNHAVAPAAPAPSPSATNGDAPSATANGSVPSVPVTAATPLTARLSKSRDILHI